MSSKEKILWSIPSFIWFFDFSLYIFPVVLKEVYNHLNTLNPSYNTLIILLSMIQIIYLIQLVWRKEIDKRKKQEWTAILVLLFPPISSLYYIWMKDSEFDKK
ncbi:MAG: hypothetical protein DRI84_04055 [Bacteroidetes bacterium]|nr:MAG: hypothetical protein DRI84_04055 [Bacteroidota bacterium]